jgi:transcriptional regulator with XRE-family HTH domain
VPKAISKRALPDPWLRAVGAQLRDARRAAGLTQEALAEAADLAPRTIQKIEAGQITVLITTLRRLRRVIGCSFTVLLPED